MTAPDPAFGASFIEALREGHQLHSAAFPTSQEIDAMEADIPGWIERATDQTGLVTLPDGGRVPKVPSSLLWAVDGDDFIGHLNARHELSAHLRAWGGHIGWFVRPSRRGKGYAKAIARLGLDFYRDTLGLDRVLITCNAANAPSRRTIEGLGGVLEAELPHPYEPGALRRYWVETR